MITRDEVEMLATLLQRAGVTQPEAVWANMMLNKLRAIATRQDAERALAAKTQPTNQAEAKSPDTPTSGVTA